PGARRPRLRRRRRRRHRPPPPRPRLLRRPRPHPHVRPGREPQRLRRRSPRPVRGPPPPPLPSTPLITYPFPTPLAWRNRQRSCLVNSRLGVRVPPPAPNTAGHRPATLALLVSRSFRGHSSAPE